MKRKLIFNILIVLSAAGGFLSCSDTWLMYDTSQKNKLYFKYENYSTLDQYVSTDLSFALLDSTTTELKHRITVTLIGSPADHDRTFEVKAIHDTTTNYTTGGVTRELVDAVENEDYTIDRLTVPAKAITGEIEVTLKRSAKLLTQTASLVLQIVENEDFQGVPRNVYRILISDGTAACPYWWYYSATQQWYQYTGEFRQDKYRKLLELYHSIADTNPTLYAEMVKQYGENIDNDYYTGLNGQQLRMSMGFMVNRQNPHKMAWLRYVLCPLYEYYKTNYPDLEYYTTGSVNVTTGGWRDPANNY